MAMRNYRLRRRVKPMAPTLMSSSELGSGTGGGPVCKPIVSPVVVAVQASSFESASAPRAASVTFSRTKKSLSAVQVSSETLEVVPPVMSAKSQ